MKNFILPLTVFLCLSSVSSADQQPEQPWLTYENVGARPYKSITLLVSRMSEQETSVSVSIKDYRDTSIDYRMTLDNRETELLKSQVVAADFFSQSNAHENHATKHAGVTELIVTLDGQTNQVRYAYLMALEPLTQHLRLMINQAIVVDKLERDKDYYAVLGAVSPQLAALKVLQPQVFAAPLRNSLETIDDLQALSRSLQSLSWLLDTDDFKNLVERGLARVSPERKSLWLTTLTRNEFYGSLNRASQNALLPVFLNELKRRYRPPRDYGGPDDSAYFSMIGRVADNRYVEAIPYLLELLDANDKPYAEAQLHALPKMGEVALKYIEKTLLSQRKVDRIVAAELLVVSARLNPNAGYYNPVSAEEFARIRQELIDTFVPMLKGMAEQDADSLVREAAKKSVEIIEAELRKA